MEMYVVARDGNYQISYLNVTYELEHRGEDEISRKERVLWQGVTSRLEVPVLGLTLTPRPVGEEPNGPRATVTQVRSLTSINSSHSPCSQSYCFSLIITPFLFFSLVALLYVAVLYFTFSPPLQLLNYFSLLSSICFSFCTLCLNRLSSLLFRIYLRLYFLFFFVFFCLSTFFRVAFLVYPVPFCTLIRCGFLFLSALLFFCSIR
jgi:hypothetical protein